MARAETEISSTRLTIDLPSHMHSLIKARASLQNLSIKDFVIKAIENDVEEVTEKKELNQKTINALRYSIKNPHKLKSFTNSADAMKWLLSDEKKVKTKKRKS